MKREEQMMDLARLAESNSRTIDLSKKQVFMSAYIQGWKDADSHPQWHDAQGDNVPEYDIINSVIGNTGWYSASEPPKEDGEYVVFCYGFDLPFKAKYSEYINDWSHNDVKWWCYPPKEE